MSLYKKKPVIVEAKLWDGTTYDATSIIDWALEYGGTIRFDSAHVNNPGFPDEEWIPETLQIETLEGTMTAVAGDHIIKGVQDEFYPCKPDIFDKTYEPIEW